jgi:transcriptional regulator of arginine metabolism
MGAQKKFRHGQILKMIASETITSQDELRRRLIHLGMRVTQATLSRDIQELRLVKTASGYKPLAAEEPPLAALERALREFLTDLRPAQNLLVLKTPPGGAQPIARALDVEGWKEVCGTIAGDDTILIITPSSRTRLIVQKKMEDMIR